MTLLYRIVKNVHRDARAGEFQVLRAGRTTIDLDPWLTAFIGTNGTGKTAAWEALLRLFGITAQDRGVRADDFHVPVDEAEAPGIRELTIEAGGRRSRGTAAR